MKKKKSNQDSLTKNSKQDKQPSVVELANKAADEIIRKYTLEAVWPSERENHLKNLASQMTVEMAALFGRDPNDLSIEDLKRGQDYIESLCGQYGISRLRVGTIRSATDAYSKIKAVTGIASHIYWIGNLGVGNFSPAIRKLGLNVGGAPLAKSAGIWLLGRFLKELYWDPKGYSQAQSMSLSYHPLFDSFNIDQLRELAVLMGLDPSVKTKEDKLSKDILKELTGAIHNKISAYWNDAPTYKVVLVSLCEELEIPNFKNSDAEEVLEERIVQRILAMSLENMTPEDLKEFERAIKRNSEDQYLENSSKATAMAGGLLAARIAGLGTYAAGTASIAAILKGMGLSFGVSTFSSVTTGISAITGPWGIGAASLYAAFQWTKSRPKKAIPFVLYMATTRAQLKILSESKESLWTRVKRFYRRIFGFRI